MVNKPRKSTKGHVIEHKKNVREYVKDFKPLISICEKYHQQPAHVVRITFIVFVFLIMIGLFRHIFVTLFGLLYPAYMSLRVKMI